MDDPVKPWTQLVDDLEHVRGVLGALVLSCPEPRSGQASLWLQHFTRDVRSLRITAMAEE